MHTLQIEIDRNFDQFQRTLAKLLPEHKGQFALMREGQVVDFYSKPSDAERMGEERYSDGIYSIQEVSDAPVDLGFFSYAIDNGALKSA